jgi:hypothetical protein
MILNNTGIKQNKNYFICLDIFSHSFSFSVPVLLKLFSVSKIERYCSGQKKPECS